MPVLTRKSCWESGQGRSFRWGGRNNGESCHFSKVGGKEAAEAMMELDAQVRWDFSGADFVVVHCGVGAKKGSDFFQKRHS